MSEKSTSKTINVRYLLKRGKEEDINKRKFTPNELVWISDKKYAAIGTEDGTLMKLDEYLSYIIENNFTGESMRDFIKRMDNMIDNEEEKQAAIILLEKFKVLCPDISKTFSKEIEIVEVIY